MKNTIGHMLFGGFLIVMNSVSVQEPHATNIPSKTTSCTAIATGPSVLGVFDGRLPCSEIAKDWKVSVDPECTKVKWSLTLFQNQARSYRVEDAYFSYTLNGVSN